MMNLITQDGKVLVSSRIVAEDFKKAHDKVCRDIDNLKTKSPKLEVEKYFIESSYKSDRGRTYKEYLMNRDGFSLLVMGFTGKEALQWKLKYIEAFNKMEEELIECRAPQLSSEDRAIIEIIHQVKAGSVPQAVGTVLEYGQEKYDEGYGKGQNDKEEELQPMIEFAEIMEKAGGKMLVREAAKMVYTKDRIEVGERKLHAVLRYWGWELFASTTTEPSQNAVKAGWLIAKPITRYNSEEDRYHITYTPYVTAKGLTLITRKLLTMTIDEVEQIYKEDKIKMKKFKSKSQ